VTDLVQRIVDRLENPLALLLALGIAWSLADGVRFFLGGAETLEPGSAAVTDAPADRAGGPVLDAAGMARLDLFGTPDAGLDPAAAEAPETRLQLELHGVFLAGSGGDSSAIVAQRNRPGELYLPGDRLPGNAELVEVLDDRIVLRRAGQLETLRFPDAGDGSGFVAGDEAAPLAAATGKDIRIGPASGSGRRGTDRTVDRGDATAEDAPGGALVDRIEQFRQRLDIDPRGTLSEVGVEPVSDGSAAGYRIGDQVSAAQLSSVGLRPGDLILSVNGQAVGDIEQDRAQLQDIVDAGSARLEIQRGDRRFFVTTRIQ
jgi:general secretion pathway protein C